MPKLMGGKANEKENSKGTTRTSSDLALGVFSRGSQLMMLMSHY